jgi:hypothetical protein
LVGGDTHQSLSGNGHPAKGWAVLPLRRIWIEHPYGEEEICLLEPTLKP